MTPRTPESAPREHPSRPVLWLLRRPVLYVPRRVTVHFVHTLHESEPCPTVLNEQDITTLLAQRVRHRHAGRFFPKDVRFDDYVPHEINAPPSAPPHAAGAASPNRCAPPVASHYTEPLTDREREVLHAAASGCSTAEIATQLVITPGTVKWHLNNIYRKLGVRRRTQAIAAARTHGFLPA